MIPSEPFAQASSLGTKRANQNIPKITDYSHCIDLVAIKSISSPTWRIQPSPPNGKEVDYYKAGFEAHKCTQGIDGTRPTFATAAESALFLTMQVQLWAGCTTNGKPSRIKLLNTSKMQNLETAPSPTGRKAPLHFWPSFWITKSGCDTPYIAVIGGGTILLTVNLTMNYPQKVVGAFTMNTREVMREVKQSQQTSSCEKNDLEGAFYEEI